MVVAEWEQRHLLWVLLDAVCVCVLKLDGCCCCWVVQVSPARKETCHSWDKLWTLNRRLLDPTAARHMAVADEGRVLLTVSVGPVGLLQAVGVKSGCSFALRCKCQQNVCGCLQTVFFALRCAYRLCFKRATAKGCCTCLHTCADVCHTLLVVVCWGGRCWMAPQSHVRLRWCGSRAMWSRWCRTGRSG